MKAVAGYHVHFDRKLILKEVLDVDEVDQRERLGGVVIDKKIRSLPARASIRAVEPKM